MDEKSGEGTLLKTQRSIDSRILTERIVSALQQDAVLALNGAPKEELQAAVSHWIWNPASRPPMFSRAMEVRVLSFLETTFPEALIHGALNPKALSHGSVGYLPARKPKLSFIDLFAGIGGFRLAFQEQGGKCAFTSEWDKYAKQTYNLNFGKMPYGDIRRIRADEIPDHDVLCAGFPCQPFSLAGVSKNESLGRRHGFEHATQGTLFFEICRILRSKRPRAFFLENVKNLVSHNSGQTFRTILTSLRKELGYIVNYAIVDGSNWVPQHRERIFIVGYDPGQTEVVNEDQIQFPLGPAADYKYPELNTIVGNSTTVDNKYTLGVGTWDTLERHKANHAAAGNGFGYGLHQWPIPDGAITRTISARYHKDGAEILINQKSKHGRPRRLTVEEAKQLQGYDKDQYRFEVSDTQAYRQIGNSVVVPAVTATAAEIARTLLKGPRRKG